MGIKRNFSVHPSAGRRLRATAAFTYQHAHPVNNNALSMYRFQQEYLSCRNSPIDWENTPSPIFLTTVPGRRGAEKSAYPLFQHQELGSRRMTPTGQAVTGLGSREWARSLLLKKLLEVTPESHSGCPRRSVEETRRSTSGCWSPEESPCGCGVVAHLWIVVGLGLEPRHSVWIPALTWRAKGQSLCGLEPWERGSKGPSSPGGGEGDRGCRGLRDGSEERGESSPGCPTHLDRTVQQRVQLGIGRF